MAWVGLDGAIRVACVRAVLVTVPNFRRGAPPGIPSNTGDGSWLAKYDGLCDYCDSEISAGTDRVRWNEDNTAVVCIHHTVTSKGRHYD